MANFIEKNLPKSHRERLITFIVGGLSFFVAISWSDYIDALVERYSPEGNGILLRGVILIIITYLAVLISINISRALDGK